MNEHEQKSKNLIIAISGPSGVGKGTIVKRLLQSDLLNLALSVSVTTRRQRPDEIDGREYFFVSEEDFGRRIQNDEFIEWVEYSGAHYGTLKKTIEDLLNSQKNVLVEIDYRGVDRLKEIFGSKNIFSIFILPPSFEVLKTRLLDRSSESMMSINQRTVIAHEELHRADDYDLCVTNDDLNRCCEELFNALKNKLTKLPAKN